MKWKSKITGSLVILAVFVVCLAVGYFTTRPVENLKEEEIFAEEAGAAAKEQTVTVYVNGEVNRPGVYSLVAGSRIKDAIEASGGFTAAADIKRVNLAKKIRDEDYIFIDTQDSSQGAAGASISGISSDGLVNINTATKEELMTVPGIGEVTAQKIIDFREKNGDFQKIEDLTKVDRIGEKTLAKFRDKIEAR
ncbi:MAG: DNA-binding protein [Firmicutes bacterium]|nr:DNA-binding protein [Bacillota bacterium]